MPGSFVEQVKKINPNIKTILYQWDSEKNWPYIHLRNQFDKIFTFDYDDSNRFGILYLSLFYTDDIIKIRYNRSKKVYDYFFLGTYSYERYKALKKIIEMNKGINFKHILYLKKTNFIREILNGRKLNPKLLSFKPIKRDDYLTYLSQSKCIIDLSHSTQSGLPIRVIEAVGALTEVLSTNQNVIKEFLNKASVGIINKEFDIAKSYISKVKIQNTSIVDEYSLTCWLKKIFIEN